MNIEIPGYTLVKQVGKGGMALVYLAKQHNMDRLVAIKILHPTIEAEQLYAERFLQEARTVATLNHPHIIPVYDVGQIERYYYIVMEYLPGCTLTHWMHIGLEQQEILTLIDSIALALYYSHSKGIVHRDIKPDNIMFRENHSAVLMDFGIAQSDKDKDSLHIDGQMIGTPAYMSPEQAQGHKVDHRSDLYSLGIVLYEMLTKKQPFVADDELSVALQQVTEPLPKLPKPLSVFEPVLSKLTAKKVEDRYQNGLDLSKDVKRLIVKVIELNSFRPAPKSSAVAKKPSESDLIIEGKDQADEVKMPLETVELSLVDFDTASSEPDKSDANKTPKKNLTITISEARKFFIFKQSHIAIDLVSDDIAQFNVQIGQVGEQLLQWHDEFANKAKKVELQFYCKPWLLPAIEKNIRQMVAVKDIYGFLTELDFTVSIYDLSGNLLAQLDDF